MDSRDAFNESEDPSNSESPRNHAKQTHIELKVQAHDDYNAPSQHHNRKVKFVPSGTEVVPPVSKYFEHRFYCEYARVHIVNNLELIQHNWVLSSPLDHQRNRVPNDAEKDKIVELFVVADFNHEISEHLVCQLCRNAWSSTVAKLQSFDPGLLDFFQQLIETQLVFFVIERFNDNTDKQVEEKQSNKDLSSDTVYFIVTCIVDYRLLVCTSGILHFVHIVYPSFGALHSNRR